MRARKLAQNAYQQFKLFGARIKPHGGLSSAIKSFAHNYVQLSACGAALGACGGGVLSVAFFIPVVANYIVDSNSDTMSGKFTDGLERAGRLLIQFPYYGALIGGAPVTYPVIKFSTYLYDRIESDQHISSVKKKH